MKQMRGTGASAGIGIGSAVIVEEAQLVIEQRVVTDVDAELERFKGTLEKAVEETNTLSQTLAERVGEKEAEILQGHIMLLSDPMLTGEIENAIKAGTNAEAAIETVCTMYADMFASMDDELMQQRATDMRDIKTRMQKILLGIRSVDIASLPAGEDLEELFFVAVGEDTDLGQVERDDAHVETTIKFIVPIFVFPRAQEGTAPHGAKDVAFVGFPHFLGRNVVGIHEIGRASCRERV